MILKIQFIFILCTKFFTRVYVLVQFWCMAELEGGVRVGVKSGRVEVQWVCYCVTPTKWYLFSGVLL